MATCRVRNCRFKTTHTTRGHTCGQCGVIGHGVIECGNNNSIQNLTQFFSEHLPAHQQCSSQHHADSTDSLVHSDACHICTRCGRRHLEDTCIIQPLSRFMNTFGDYFRTFDIEKLVQHSRDLGRPCVCELNVGMGCSIYIKVYGYNDDIETARMGLFMHSDSRGQYGEASSHVPLLEEFKIGSTEFEVIPQYNDGGDGGVDYDDGDGIGTEEGMGQHRERSCPVCRAPVKPESIKPIYGMTNKCTICLDAVVDRFFVGCGHACICSQCLEQL